MSTYENLVFRLENVLTAITILLGMALLGPFMAMLLVYSIIRHFGNTKTQITKI